METNYFCNYLDWDSNFFDRRIACATVKTLTNEKIDIILNWCVSQAIDCLYFLGSSDDAKTIRLAEDNGFRFVDIRLTLERHFEEDKAILSEQNFSGSIRLVQPDDIPALKAIARRSFRFTRFYFDGYFPPERCDNLYEIWTEKSCHGYSDVVFVAEIQRSPCGFITCQRIDDYRGQIGLIAVKNKFHGKGIGKALVNQSFNWFTMNGMRDVQVVTQLRTIQTQRLYQGSGFLTKSVEFWYHKWFTK